MATPSEETMTSHVTFRLNSEANVCGTSLQSYMTGNFQKLVELFGEPIESDGCKISGEWIFESENGDVVTLYDWKMTSLYDGDLPSVEEFRALDSYSFHIGAESRLIADQFSSWFMSLITNKIEGGRL